MSTAFQEILREIARKHPKQTGREATWLAATLGTSVQTVNNWKLRGIPAKNHKAIADALGWTMERVAGVEDPAPVAWQFERVPFSRFDALTEREKGVVEQAMLDAMNKMHPVEAKGSSGKRFGQA